MGIYLPNMEMPKNCSGCQLNYDQMSCSVTGTRWWSDTMVLMGFDSDKERLHDCPLVEIPTPHGVLKDTTAFDERIRDRYCKKCERRFGIKNGKRKEVYEIGGVPCRACDISDMLDWLDDAPTVIEAEGSEAK